MSQLSYRLILRAGGYVLATTLLLLFVLNSGQLQAAVLVQLSPSAGQPQPVGTTITWKALATDTNPGTLEYQFSVQPLGGDFAVVRDFTTSDSFEWTPSEHEGDYNILVKVRNDSTLEVAQLSASYTVSSRVAGSDPVVNGTGNPLVALYSAPACDAGSMRVRFWRAGDVSSKTTSWKSCQPGLSMNFYVAGMLANTQYAMQHEVISDPAASVTTGPTLSFTTGTPPAGFPATFVVLPPPGASGQDVLLHAYVGGVPSPFLSATNLDGQLLWYYGRRITHATEPCDGGTMLVHVDGLTLRVIDLAGNTVRETHIKAVADQIVAGGGQAPYSFHHEARCLPNGSIVALTYVERTLSNVQGPGPVTITGDMIVVLDKNWRVTWSWNAFDHLDVTRKAILNERCATCSTTGGPANDWLHSNAVTYSPADGNLLLSVRHQDWLIKLDYRDGVGAGQVLWRLGKGGDFTTDSTDPYPWFSHQHDAEYELGDPQTITLFDNGNTRRVVSNATANSRGQAWKLDETNHTASLQLNADLGGYSAALGAAQKLADGNYHFLSGFLSGSARSIEVGPDGALRFIIQSQATTYRSFRMRDLYTPPSSSLAGNGDTQTISFDAVAGKTYGDADFDVSATASSGLPVSFQVVSGPATISGNTVTITGAGAVVLQADQDGNIRYNPARSVRQSFVVAKASQAITVGTHAPSSAAYNSTFDVSATSDSGLPVSYSSSGACTNNGATFTMTSGTGVCTVKYDQAGDSNYSAAAQVTESVTAQKASQTITFAAIPDKTFGAPDFAVGATASSGLGVSFAATGDCTLTGSTVHLTGAGSCAVTAKQNGDSNFNAAPDAVRSFTINKAGQTITFGALADKTYGDASFTVSATGGASGNPITFASQTPTVCSVSSGMVTMLGAGTCTVRASQAGNSNYNDAASVDRSFQVAQAATSTAVTSSPNPSGVGQGVTYTATVTSAAGAPAGVVRFLADGVLYGPTGVPCVAGVGNSCTAELRANPLPAGNHAITAEYLGNANFLASTGTLAGGQKVFEGGVFEFSQSAYTVGERGGSVTVTVVRNGDTSLPVMVDYATDPDRDPTVFVPCAATAGAALDRCDYARSLGTLRFAAGVREQTFTVLVNDDAYVEGTETLPMRLSNPSGGSALGALTTATLEITDDPTESAGNVIDENQKFVTQHYHDFLNREPDADGLAFWTAQMTDCGSPNLEVCRVNVSAAFFQSIEFQNTGYLVERMYKAAYGDMVGSSTLGGSHQLSVPRVSLFEFLRDTQLIRQGVIVGQGSWQLRLEENKAAFAREFVSRQEFLLRYPGTTSAADLVDSLDANAGGVLDAAERSALISELSPNPGDRDLRASVVRKVAEDADLVRRESNRAFVLMEYFGYLRRNPFDAPDTNYTGYDFWLQKLNQFDGDYVRAEMVKAFLSSDEYRKRFGQ